MVTGTFMRRLKKNKLEQALKHYMHLPRKEKILIYFSTSFLIVESVKNTSSGALLKCMEIS
jgi:hypothetical protein